MHDSYQIMAGCEDELQELCWPVGLRTSYADRETPDGHATIVKHMAVKSLSVNLDMPVDLRTCLPFRSHTLSRYS